MITESRQHLHMGVLANLIINCNDSIHPVIEAGITADLFDSVSHQIIFETIINLFEADGRIPNELSIFDALMTHESWGDQLLSDWVDIISKSDCVATILYWLPKFIKERKETLGNRAYMSYKNLHGGTDQGSVDDMHEARGKLIERVNLLGAKESNSMDGALENLLKQCERVVNGERAIIPFELPHLPYSQETITPFQKQELVVIGARPATGKSSFLNQAILGNILNGKKGILFNLEMTTEKIYEQLACIHGQHDSNKIRNSPHEMGKYIDTVKRLAPYIKDNLNIVTGVDSAKVMNSILDNHIKKDGVPDFIGVDYLQLISSGSKTDNRTTQVGEVSRMLKQWTVRHECPVFALSQLNRSGEADGRRPKLADLRESGSIEQDADRVLFLHCPMTDSDGHDQSEQPIREVLLIQEKCRTGPVGTVIIKFKRSTTSFQNQR